MKIYHTFLTFCCALLVGGILPQTAMASSELSNTRLCIGFKGTAPRDLEERRAGPYHITCYQDGLEIVKEQSLYAACRYYDKDKSWAFSGFFLRPPEGDLVLLNIGTTTTCQITKTAQ